MDWQSVDGGTEALALFGSCGDSGCGGGSDESVFIAKWWRMMIDETVRRYDGW